MLKWRFERALTPRVVLRIYTPMWCVSCGVGVDKLQPGACANGG
jgi:hypothetical protein